MSSTFPGPVTQALHAVTAVLVVVALAACTGDDSSSEGTDPAPEVVPETSSASRLERYEGQESEVYGDLANWVCHPDAEDVCDGGPDGAGLDATVVEADGTLTEESWSPDPDAPVDCFYVYPTISRDPGAYSDRISADEEEGYAAVNQVARLGEVCRVFAPVYRQRTLAGLGEALGNSTTTTASTAGDADENPPLDDVLEAWRHYMAVHNEGRGVVLVGHSQGAALLNELVRTEIDPNDDVRDLLVSAYLAGWAVGVPDGEDVGGDFTNIPLCRTEDQIGCVVSWAAYRDTAPPPEGALFGRPRGGEGVAACNSPASLAGGEAELGSYFPANAGASILSSLGTADTGATWVAPSAGEVTTPFVATPGLVRGECVTRDGFHYLEVRVQPDPTGPRSSDIGGDLTLEWGLHLVDVNLVMGDMVGLVRSQSAAHTER